MINIPNATPVEKGDVGSPDWTKDSLALIVSDGDKPFVWYWVGPHLAEQIDALGSRDPDELGCYVSGAGIYVWEGRLGYGHYDRFNGDYTDPELITTCVRPPTQAELDKAVLGVNPWDENDWVVREEEG